MTTKSVLCPPCLLCGDRNVITVEADAYDKWVNGTLVQDAFPEMDTPHREMLVSGTCPDCWDTIFD